MKTKNLFGLLLFICTISFVCCNDEDNTEPAYRLELSENTCEVMQGRSSSINLISNENTTLDIADPELIDAAYIWGSHDNFTAAIEITGKQKGETSIIVTDHETGESATIKVKVTEYPMPRIAVKQSKGNIFDFMDFYIYNEGTQPILLKELDAVCDSIVWTVKGQNGSYQVFYHKADEGYHEDHLSMGWGHCFKFPGEYEAYLTAWKENKVVSRDSLDITITDDKDFLGYNWTDITKTSQAWTSYADVLGSSLALMVTSDLNGTVPSVEVRVFNEDNIQNYNELYNYFCKLYSQPTYDDQKEKQKIFKLYDELFSEQKKYPSDYPCAIWVTERVNFVLLMLEDGSQYAIYAEPARP